jgi:hypothetical protein
VTAPAGRTPAETGAGAFLHAALRRLGAVSTIAVIWACRHAAPPTPLPSDWATLRTTPVPFAALYRLACCTRRNLVATVRFDGSNVDLLVTVQPGGAVERAWVTREGGWVFDGREGCVGRLPAGELPLAEGRSLPLDPELISSLLTGRLLPGANPLGAAPGWVVGSAGGFAWRARIVADPTRVVRLVVARPGAEEFLLDASLDDYRPDGIPGRLKLRAGESLELRLVSWRRGGALAVPAWVAGPLCGAGS